VVQVAPPLISDAKVLDELVDRLGEVLMAVAEHMDIPTSRQPRTGS
jgi:adenosylmethionine-8-amino-7-oxononanoate aminotransferase